MTFQCSAFYMTYASGDKLENLRCFPSLYQRAAKENSFFQQLQFLKQKWFTVNIFSYH